MAPRAFLRLLPLVLAGLAGCLGSDRSCGPGEPGGGGATLLRDPAYLAREHDALVAGMLARPDASAPAAGWLADPAHVFVNETPLDPAGIVRELEGAGARWVRVGDLFRQSGREASSTFIVGVPKDREARSRLFEAARRLNRSLGEIDPRDLGQESLTYDFD